LWGNSAFDILEKFKIEGIIAQEFRRFGPRNPEYLYLGENDIAGIRS
jgi:hypothetical protein